MFHLGVIFCNFGQTQSHRINVICELRFTPNQGPGWFFPFSDTELSLGSVAAPSFLGKSSATTPLPWQHHLGLISLQRQEPKINRALLCNQSVPPVPHKRQRDQG